jgi:hypothetical protein
MIGRPLRFQAIAARMSLPAPPQGDATRMPHLADMLAQDVRLWPVSGDLPDGGTEMETSAAPLDLAVEDASEMRWEELVSEMTGEGKEFVNQCNSCPTTYICTFCATDVFTSFTDPDGMLKESGS